MNIYNQDLEWATKTNSNAKAKSTTNRGPDGGHIAFLSFEHELESPTTTKNNNNNNNKFVPSGKALSPSLNRLNQHSNSNDMRKQAIKKQAFNTAANNAMPPPPTRRPSRQAPLPPPPTTSTAANAASSSSTTSSSPMDGTSSKRSADDKFQSGQKPTKRRRVGTTTKNNLGETVEKTALDAENLDNDESIPMEVDVPTPVPVRSAKEKKEQEAANEEADIQRRAEEYKTLGNDKYTAGRYTEAASWYSKASDLVHNTSPIYLCNRAACRLMLKEFEQALEDALSAIAIDHTYARALERAGKASLHLGKGKDSSKYLTHAIESLRKDTTTANAAKNLQKMEQLKGEVAKADRYEHSMSRAERSIKRHDGAGKCSLWGSGGVSCWCVVLGNVLTDFFVF
jgi:tetratricopeptide (TPR) repeat protein